ncbi:MAG: heparan-alpha-glucosaminide N-acetyltransferase domain-containing protein [Bacteroidota bacterium]
MTNNHRIYYLDAIRGIALFIMVFANCVPYLPELPGSFAIRAVDSLAAPVFIALAGYGISRMNKGGNTSWLETKLILRALLTLAAAALMDMLIWGIMPFTGYDVLYLIGFGVLLAAFMSRFPNFWLVALILAVICISFYFQSKGYYQRELNDYPLEAKFWQEIPRSWGSWLIYGWFPVFPWLAVFFFGYLGGKNTIRFGRYKLIVSICLVLAISFALIILYHDDKLIRSGYSELFYPADLAFLVFALGLTALVWINRTFFNHKAFRVFRVLGRSSLFVYILHAVLISFALKFFYALTEENTILTLLLVYACIYALSFLLLYIKRVSAWKKTPYLVRFLFGS